MHKHVIEHKTRTNKIIINKYLFRFPRRFRKFAAPQTRLCGLWTVPRKTRQGF